MNCIECGVALPVGSNPRQEFCTPAHRQKYYRKKRSKEVQAIPGLYTELKELRAKVSEQARTIEELRLEIGQLGARARLVQQLQDESSEQASEIARLREKLDVERRYLEDTTPRTFKAWLKKQPWSPWRIRVLSDQLVPARGSRSLYEAHVRRLCTDEEERDDFVRLWKLMLLQS